MQWSQSKMPSSQSKMPSSPYKIIVYVSSSCKLYFLYEFLSQKRRQKNRKDCRERGPNLWRPARVAGPSAKMLVTQTTWHRLQSELFTRLKRSAMMWGKARDNNQRAKTSKNESSIHAGTQQKYQLNNDYQHYNNDLQMTLWVTQRCFIRFKRFDDQCLHQWNSVLESEQ